ncbi:MAG: hypothetical protein CVV33_03495 [Methanomicrobiales archaeon HGW-Methanomicrobiales-4]|nr:MAG: hypothetical protein CVV33_03495 [Methanomicrobiales archaeon HGW-Methanomicrobiales-4]
MTEVQLSIPDEIVQTLHLKIPLETEIIESFAISLYEQGRISSGEAALLTGLNRRDWENLLRSRNVMRSYNFEDVTIDLAYANSSK